MLWDRKQYLLLDCVINLKYLWLILLSMLGVGSAIIVLYYPKLQLPNSPEFQLFDSSHPFEQYDFEYKNHFWFKRYDDMMVSDIKFILIRKSKIVSVSR